jgi:ferredoxin
MSRPLWFVRLCQKAYSARFFFARLSRLPPWGALADRVLFHGDRLFMLPNDPMVQRSELRRSGLRRIEVQEAVDPPEGVVLPSRVVEHFVEQASHHWIMNRCICRETGHCQDYPVDLGCLFLGEAVLGINPRLGRLVTKEEALAHIRRCEQAGLVHLIGRNKMDTIWLGIGPGDKLLTICNCCPCCCIWGTLPHMAPFISDKVSRMEGVRVTVNDRCVGCGRCTQGACWIGAIHLLDGRATIDEDLCRGCGRCVQACPRGAIELAIEYDHTIEKVIALIAPLVDVS